MLNYKQLFEPFTGNGATLEKTMAWLKKTTQADQAIIDQVIAEAMYQVSKGETFSLPCPCGCEMTNVHTPIEHYMVSEIKRMKKEVDLAQVEFINTRQKKLVEDQLKRLSNFDKEYDKAMNGTWVQKNLPTFRKWVGLK